MATGNESDFLGMNFSSSNKKEMVAACSLDQKSWITSYINRIPTGYHYFLGVEQMLKK